MRITSLRDSPAPAADRALVPTSAQEALADLRAAIVGARLGTVLWVALVEVWPSTDRARFVGDPGGTPMLLVHEVGPGAGRASALFPPTPQGVAAAGAWVRKNLPSES